MLPVTVKNGMFSYQLIDEMKRVFEERNLNNVWIDALALAEIVGNVHVLNSIMIGFMAAKAKTPLKIETLKKTIAAHVPVRTIELNLKAFDMGLELGSE